MKNLALTNIGELVTNDPEINNGQLGIIENAGVVIADGLVTWVGPASELKSQANSDKCLNRRYRLPRRVEKATVP